MEQRTLLTAMTDFVLEQVALMNRDDINILQFRNAITNYANFLKRPLELGFFIPCDENGDVLEEPKPENFFDVKIIADEFQELDKAGFDKYTLALMDFEQAKERVLFEYNPEFMFFDKSDMEKQTIEDLLSDDINYMLSPSAIQQLKLK